jgi:hypothetical protein
MIRNRACSGQYRPIPGYNSIHVAVFPEMIEREGGIWYSKAY